MTISYTILETLTSLIDTLDSENPEAIARERANAKDLVGNGGSFKREKLVNEVRLLSPRTTS